MRQLVGWRDEERTVRDLLLSLSPPARAAGRRALDDGRGRERPRDPSDRTGLALGAGARRRGATPAAGTPRCSGTRARRIAMRQPFDAAGRAGGSRRCRAASRSGSRSRSLLRSDADVLLLDEPDNYLDVAGQGVARGRAARRARRRSCSSATTARCSRAVADKVVTLEGQTAWTHGASFATWHEARDDRLARIDEEHRRWQEERKRLRAVAAASSGAGASMGSDKFASRVRATKSKIERFEATAPTDRVAGRRRCRCGSAAIAPASGSIVCEQLELARAHRPVRHRGAVRRARRGARPERHRQEPLPPPARGRAGRPRRHAGGSARASCPATSRRPTTSPSSAASRCSTS